MALPPSPFLDHTSITPVSYNTCRAQCYNAVICSHPSRGCSSRLVYRDSVGNNWMLCAGEFLNGDYYFQSLQLLV
uniref:Uncharacterized protein n=1 Tax=Physcomitrium patens TaxID=3218 RepID=A0A2K1LB63_PHYPA|nr:hypothetical protein PHYPA_001691 [Physcomitrium patens]